MECIGWLLVIFCAYVLAQDDISAFLARRRADKNRRRNS